MKVSVIIPAYNEEKSIGSTIRSVFEQTLKPYEIIVVDNNCNDRTSEIAKEMGVRVIVEKKQGLSFARNAGFDAAKGDVYVKLDADSELGPNSLEDLLKEFTEGNILASGLSLDYGHRAANMLARHIYRPASKVLLRHEVLFGPCYAIRGDVWVEIKKKVENDDDKIHEDLEMARCISELGDINLLVDEYVQTDPRRLKTRSMYTKYVLKYMGNIKTAFVKKYKLDELRSGE